jgi:hypothetical protein
MTDRYEKIRKALAKGPMQGPWGATLRDLLAERDAQSAEIDALRKDAERYRWLKKSAFCNVWARGDGIALVAPRTPMADIDSRIDAAIDQARGKAGQEVVE